MTSRALPSLLIRDGLEALTDADIDTLRVMIDKGVGANSLRATSSDLTYLEAWYRAAAWTPDQPSLPWPPGRDLVLKFLAHHVYDADLRDTDGRHGMPEDVEAELRAGGYLRAQGPHATSTIKRRLSTWASMCRWRGVEDVFRDPQMKQLIARSLRGKDQRRKPKSKRSVTSKDILAIARELDPVCRLQGYDGLREKDPAFEAYRLAALRDRALIGVGFSSGGRRRSEIVNIQLSMLEDLEPLQIEGESVPQLAIHLGRTKTRDADQDQVAILSGTPVAWLEAWIREARISHGFVFRRITRWGKVGNLALGPGSVNDILKKRLAQIGHDPADFSAHGLRSGFITEALSEGIPLAEVMEQSGHSSVQQAASYFRREAQRRGRAARLLD